MSRGRQRFAWSTRSSTISVRRGRVVPAPFLRQKRWRPSRRAFTGRPSEPGTAAYLHALASGVVAGLFEVEELGAQADLPDDEVASRLLALPGIGPYGAAHLMMLLGRHSRLILDSWTRPKYAKVNGRKASDATVERRFRRYGRYSGLAFWLYLTRDWVL